MTATQIAISGIIVLISVVLGVYAMIQDVRKIRRSRDHPQKCDLPKARGG